MRVCFEEVGRTYQSKTGKAVILKVHFKGDAFDKFLVVKCESLRRLCELISPVSWVKVSKLEKTLTSK